MPRLHPKHQYGTEFDNRDPNTTWIWINDNEYVEINIAELVDNMIQNCMGYYEQEEGITLGELKDAYYTIFPDVQRREAAVDRANGAPLPEPEMVIVEVDLLRRALSDPKEYVPEAYSLFQSIANIAGMDFVFDTPDGLNALFIAPYDRYPTDTERAVLKEMVILAVDVSPFGRGAVMVDVQTEKELNTRVHMKQGKG